MVPSCKVDPVIYMVGDDDDDIVKDAPSGPVDPVGPVGPVTITGAAKENKLYPFIF